MLRRGLILGRYTLACWQKQKVNKAMRRLGEQFFQALERGETNPLVVSEVSDAVNQAKEVKEAKDKNYQAVAAIREKIRAAWAKEPPPVPAAETPPAAAEPTGEPAALRSPRNLRLHRVRRAGKRSDPPFDWFPSWAWEP